MRDANILSWQAAEDGLAFRVQAQDGRGLPVDQWGSAPVVVQDGRAASVASLLGMIEDEVVEAHADHVVVPHGRIAELDDLKAGQLGLPPIAPLRLKLSGQGILTSSSFRFRYQLVKADGSAPMGLQRQGTILSMGRRRYLLLNPLYALLEGIDAFNQAPPGQMDERMLRWAELKPLLPEDAVVDNSLRSMNIVRADSFTLDIDDRGDIAPQLLHRPRPVGVERELQDQPVRGSPALPETPQREFEKRFKALSRAQAHYTAPGNWFVVVPEGLKKAMQVVRDYQDASAEERQAFVANPTAVLRDQLGDELDEVELDRLFEETPEFLSARVAHLGIWRPKVNAYLLPSGQDWLPNDERAFGFVLDGRLYAIEHPDLQPILSDVLRAREEGRSSVEYRGQVIPASDEMVDLLQRLVGASPEEEPCEEVVGAKPADESEQLVPILIDNIEEIGFAVTSRKIRGDPGGLPQVLQTTSLYPHQREGLRWLQEHWAKGSSGALLADDMGLGKTLQTLAFLALVQEQMEVGNHPQKPVMIVAPTGLLRNWEDEASLHLSGTGLGKLFRAYGKEMRDLKGLSHNQRKAQLESVDWVLTTYETLRDKIRYFTPIDWAVVVYDEAQKIKNPASRLTEMAKAVAADFFLALTGTPVENRLADLWSIMDLVAPGELGALREFHHRYESGEGEEQETAIHELRSYLTEKTQPTRLLRRMKSDHLKGLPDKNEHLLREEMPPAQAAAYDAVIEPAYAGELGNGKMLKILHGIRRVSLVPDVLGPGGLTDSTIAASARLTALIQILDTISDQGEKALVFLEFLDIQEALLPYLQQRYHMVKPPLRITGEVSGQVRKKHVDEYQAGEAGCFDIMLLSPKAGGVGLTLTAANHVIHLSRWWNPAVEDQCTDRVYRIGQEKDIHVYYPMAIHPAHGERSFDINLHSLLERKRALSRELLAPPMVDTNELGQLLSASA